ncbi:MAG: cobalamin-independent methionine synthase II family protein [Candidatus Magasanikbacteria bacterium]|nr:cobalamin-independent methionine synthase II family protein [Candidatus Magasanikbacteria bacterium]
MTNLPLFPASIVGSLPRPLFVQDIILNQGDPWSPEMDNAVRYALALQESAGLDIVSDGEWRRKSYLEPIAQVASGIAHWFKDGQSWHTIVTPLQQVNPGWFAREAKFLKQHTGRQIKVCLPSPYLLGERLWDSERSRQAYPTRAEFRAALVPILRAEIKLLAEAGADIIQIDDPHICLFVDSAVRAKYPDPEAELAEACRLVNATVEGITGATTALHLCRRNKGRRGWIGEGGYEPIIPALANLRVNQLVMEYSIPVAGDLRALRLLPQRFTVGLGCVDCRFAHIDTPEEIVARVQRALRYVPAERIILNPDCGFAPGSQAEVPLDEAYQKLKNEARAAEILRAQYSRMMPPSLSGAG